MTSCRRSLEASSLNLEFPSLSGDFVVRVDLDEFSAGPAKVWRRLEEDLWEAPRGLWEPPGFDPGNIRDPVTPWSRVQPAYMHLDLGTHWTQLHMGPSCTRIVVHLGPGCIWAWVNPRTSAS